MGKLVEGGTMMRTGLVGYGACIPKFRMAVEEIHKVWNNTVLEMLRGIQIEERAVLQPDEDTITLAVLAAKRALKPVSYTHLTLPTSDLCRSRWSPYH